MDKLLRDKKAILIFIIPPLAIYLFAVFLPIVWSVVYSLFQGTPNLGFEFNGLNNYGKMWFDDDFREALFVTLRYVVVVVAGQVGLGFLLSLMFAFTIKKYKTLVRTLVFFPVVLPIVAVGQLFTKIVDFAPQYGLLNSILDTLGLEFLIQPWMGQSATALGVLFAMDIWRAMGFYAVIFYAALVAIPKDILEAARIDGASGLKMVRRIILPMLKPIMLTCLIFSFSGTLKVFESSIALNRGGPGTATRTLSMYVYNTAFYGDFGYGSAIAVFILIECLFVSIVLSKLFTSKNKL